MENAEVLYVCVHKASWIRSKTVVVVAGPVAVVRESQSSSNPHPSSMGQATLGNTKKLRLVKKAQEG